MLYDLGPGFSLKKNGYTCKGGISVKCFCFSWQIGLPCQKEFDPQEQRMGANSFLVENTSFPNVFPLQENKQEVTEVIFL